MHKRLTQNRGRLPISAPSQYRRLPHCAKRTQFHPGATAPRPKNTKRTQSHPANCQKPTANSQKPKNAKQTQSQPGPRPKCAKQTQSPPISSPPRWPQVSQEFIPARRGLVGEPNPPFTRLAESDSTTPIYNLQYTIYNPLYFAGWTFWRELVCWWDEIRRCGCAGRLD